MGEEPRVKRKMTEISTSRIFPSFFFSFPLFAPQPFNSKHLSRKDSADVVAVVAVGGGGGRSERAALTRPHSLIPVTVMSTSRVPFGRLWRPRRAPRSRPVYGLSNGLQTHYQQSRAAPPQPSPRPCTLPPPLTPHPVSAGFSGARGVGAPRGSLCVLRCLSVCCACATRGACAKRPR